MRRARRDKISVRRSETIEPLPEELIRASKERTEQLRRLAVQMMKQNDKLTEVIVLGC